MSPPSEAEHVRHKLVNKGGRITCEGCPMDVPEPTDEDLERGQDNGDEWFWVTQW